MIFFYLNVILTLISNFILKYIIKITFLFFKMTMFELNDIFTDEDKAILYIEKKGLLFNGGQCEKCDGLYEFYLQNSTYTGVILECTKCHDRKSMFHNSFFTRSQIPVKKVLRIIYCWSQKFSRNQTAHECDVSKKTVTNYFQALRQTCLDWANTDGQKMIGGPGLTVEIDESLMTTRKNNAGRVPVQNWIFGGICRETRERFVVSVPDRTSQTLIPLIQKNIAPQSNINSDSWRAYRRINDLPQQYSHNTVNHHKNFVNPTNGTHTQTVERMWREVKRVKRRYEGISSNDMNDHIGEYLWREKFHVTEENAFEMTIKLISESFYF